MSSGESNGMDSEKANPSEVADPPQKPCFVVGIGASAGGQNALEQIFTALPSDCGLAFVVIMHLPAEGPSFLAEMLGRYTPMNVLIADDGLEPLPDTVHVIPAGRQLTLHGGRFRLEAPEEGRGAFHPIDHFFLSLASEVGERSIAVVLSGFGTDGAKSVKAVREAGGIVVVQEPRSALNPGMPRSVVGSGMADFILPAEEIAEKIVDIARGMCPLPSRACLATTLDEDLAAIFGIVRARTGHDFSSYKRNTVIRRIERRMAVNEVAGMKKYISLLETDEQEARALGQEILIGVTSFFRDPEAFESLRREILPRLFEGRKPEEPVRIWHACCATGEEVYSTAILIREYLDEHRLDFRVQFFATDIDEAAIAQARAGVYSDEIEEDVDEERLKTFFSRVDGRWQVAKQLREMIVFAHHSIIKDPPFSRLDLLVCRNFLIYLNPDMQKRLFALFHMALKPTGFLFLGASETVGRNSDLFADVDKRWKIFERLVGGRRDDMILPFTASVRRFSRSELPPPQSGREPRPGQIAEKLMIERYSPPFVVVNENYEVLHVSTRANRFLDVPAGEWTRDFLKMARAELRPSLRAAIYKSFNEGKKVAFRGVKVDLDGVDSRVNVQVEPLKDPPSDRKLAMVVLEQSLPLAPVPAPADGEEARSGDEASREMLIRQLEEQLRITHEQLQAVTEQLETSQEGFMSANEELISINEEFQSANEELQSTNEELETSKEELQALNEELVTVNAELQGKVEELDRTNSDMENLFRSSEVATVFLDPQLAIRRFSPAMAGIFNLIAADIGRPFRHMAGTIDWGGLAEDARSVLASLDPVEREVATLDAERHFLMRVLPYRGADARVDGVVVTLVDITEHKRAEKRIRSAALFPEENPFPVLRVRGNGALSYANRAAADLLEQWQCSVGKAVPESVRKELAAALESGETRELQLQCDGHDLSLALVPIPERGYVNFYGRDMTERNRAEKELRRSKERLKRAQEIARLGSWELDLVENTLTWSDEVYRIFGLQPQEFGASYEAFLEAVHPDDRAAVDAAYTASVEEGRDSYEIEHRVVRKSTGEIRHVHEKCQHSRNETGRIIRSVGMVHDITDQKRAAKELQSSNQRLHVLAETASRLLVSDSPQEAVDSLCRKVIEFLDCHAFFNFLVDEEAGRLRLNTCAGIPDEEAERIEWLDYGVAVCGCAARDACRIVAEDIPNTPDPRTELVKSYGIRAYACHPLVAQGRVLGTLSFGTRSRNRFSEDDLSLMKAVADQVAIAMERKRAEEELRRAKSAAEAATRAKGQFLANMSHELRTPMTGVLGMLDLALHGELSDEQRGFLEKVRTSAHALLRILNDILEFSRVEARMVTLVEEPFLLHESVRAAVELFDLEARRKGLKLELEIAPETPELMAGDDGRVRQILVNLVGNAVKFTDRGEVTVRVEAGEAASGALREIAFTVSDTGIGISRENQSSIFQPFCQGDVSHTRRFGGTGLGLAISKEVAERMGGTLSFSSEPGVGSTFRVALPLRETEMAAPAPSTSAPAADPVPASVAAGAARPRLLIAEDDANIRELLGAMLRHGGLDFDCAVNGEEALKMWARGEYDLILMDVQMPIMDGFKATRLIRGQEKEKGGHVPIVALTAHAYQADQRKCLDAGMDAYAAKPIDFQKLFAVIKDLLGSRGED